MFPWHMPFLKCFPLDRYHSKTCGGISYNKVTRLSTFIKKNLNLHKLWKLQIEESRFWGSHMDLPNMLTIELGTMSIFGLTQHSACVMSVHFKPQSLPYTYHSKIGVRLRRVTTPQDQHSLTILVWKRFYVNKIFGHVVGTSKSTYTSGQWLLDHIRNCLVWLPIVHSVNYHFKFWSLDSNTKAQIVQSGDYLIS